MNKIIKAVLHVAFSPLREMLRPQLVPTRNEIWRYGI